MELKPNTETFSMMQVTVKTVILVSIFLQKATLNVHPYCKNL